MGTGAALRGRFIVILLCGSLVAIALIVPEARSHVEGAVVTSYKALVPVVVDGRWTTPHEWNDTVEQIALLAGTFPKMVTGAYVRLKHDALSLYVLIDFVLDTRIDPANDTYLHPDAGWVFLDTAHEGSAWPNLDDYTVILAWYNTTCPELAVFRGDGRDWIPLKEIPRGLTAASSTNATYSPRTQRPHLIYEFAIPLSLFPSGVETAGVGFMAVDHATVQGSGYPVGFTFPYPLLPKPTPDKFADLVFSAVPVPELSSVPLAALIALVATTLIPRRRPVIRCLRKSI